MAHYQPSTEITTVMKHDITKQVQNNNHIKFLKKNISNTCITNKEVLQRVNETKTTPEMWADAQRDGRPAEYRWRPLFNAAKFG